MRRTSIARAALAGALVILSVAAAVAQTCTATMTDMNFGNVEVALNQDAITTGDLFIIAPPGRPTASGSIRERRRAGPPPLAS
jgi:hypothetical protein